jgi:hypothetical protein
MTLRYTDIEPLLAAGKTPAEIASLLAVRTVKPIQIADLENYVGFQGIAWRNPITSAWQGPLIDAMNNEQFPELLRGGISVLMSHVNKPRSLIVDTTQEPWASQASALLPGLIATGVLTETQAGEILALAGGHKYPGIDEAAVQAVIDRQANQVLADGVKAWLAAKLAVVNGGLYDLTIMTKQQVRDVFGGD